MSSRDTKSLQVMLKVFFKKGAAASLPERKELVVSPEMERELSADSPLSRRLRAIRDISDKALVLRIQEGGVEKIWSRTRDLLQDGSAEARHAALGMLRCVAEGQADCLLVMRTVLFTYLRDSPAAHPPEDYQYKFKLLHTLTDSGKNITCFEEQIGSLVLAWLPQLPPGAHLTEFLALVINVVKYNATYLDEEIVHGIVNNACQLCVQSADSGVVQAALSLLEAVLSYSLLPRAALRRFVAALCRTVNIEHYCQPSWKLMRSVVGADIGHAALQEMVDILQWGGGGGDGESGDGGGGDAGEVDAGLMRGAVFYINMALWGPRRVPTLKVSYLAVLTAFLKALEYSVPVVTYEVLMATQSLVARAGADLHDVAWDGVLDILRACLRLDKSADPTNEMILARVHDIISSLERLQDAGEYRGDPDALLALLDGCARDRPEASAMRAVTLMAGAAPLEWRWAARARALYSRHVRLEPRRAVRLHALAAVHALARRRALLAVTSQAPAGAGGGGGGGGEEESEPPERVAAALLAAAASDADVALRAAAAQHAADLAHCCAGDACIDLIDLLEKILNRAFDAYVQPEAEIPAEADLSDARAAAAALLGLLHARLLREPPAHALRCFGVLLDHLETHYRRPALFKHFPDIRIKILDMLFSLRVNAYNNVGFCYDSSGAVLSGAAAAEARVRPLCSPFLVAEGGAGGVRSGALVMPGARVALAVCTALGRERDWAVLGGAVRALPALLSANALALGPRAHHLDALAGTLCELLRDGGRALPDALYTSGGGARPLASEVHAAVLGALGALAPHVARLEPATQQRAVHCLLKYGMVLRAPQPYIAALTVFALEARDTMVKMLPSVLLDLSKISSTQAIASPMLEFLSTLTRLPRVFASFVEDQYMSVFAILLPYTNPSRYNHYVVSLAHHVIAAWFLKCRLAYRRNFVQFIIHGLHNYIIMPFEEQLHTNRQPTANEDSSNRKRSSSLGSRAVSGGRPLGAGGGASGSAAGGAAGGGGASTLSASAAFHVELTETCVDLLARYTFTPVSIKPQRSDTANFIFSGGQSTTWVVGHKVITITTSGCLQNSIKQGLCERCAVLCRQHAEDVASELAPPDAALAPALTPAHTSVQVQAPEGEAAEGAAAGPAPEVKRYSKYSLQHSRSTDTSASSLSISDALLPPTPSPLATRQNSAELAGAGAGAGAHALSGGPAGDVLQHLAQRGERLAREEGEPGAGAGAGWWSRLGALAASNACVCWCAHWAEVHVRSPTGDVSWVMRTQNQVSWDYMLESPLQEVLALLNPAPPAAPPAPVSSASSGIGDSRQDVTLEDEPRSRSGSATSQPRHQDLHKSSSDSVVAGPRRAPHAASHCIAPPQPQPHPPPPRASTQPINIPSSPQRQSSSSTADEDDLLLLVPEGKSRHPVRRSNSSPEMSSSWKLSAPRAADRPPPPHHDYQLEHELPLDPDDLILLPAECPDHNSTAMSLHASKKASKKNDMRVSCEAIPEEMSGTSPLAPQPHAHTQPHTQPHAQPHTQPAQQTRQSPHPNLVTYNSDPGTSGASGAARDEGGEAQPAAPGAAQLQKVASDSQVVTAESRKPPPAPAPACPRDDLPPLARSKRSNTISVMSPTRRTRDSVASGAGPGGGGGAGGGGGGGGGALPSGVFGGGGGGVTPSFVMLQLYHNMSTYPICPPVPGQTPAALNPLTERPLKVTDAKHERTIKNLDRMPPVETYKVGVLYVGPGQQDDEVAILKNEYGSVGYSEFLSQLGTLVSLDSEEEHPGLFLNVEKGGRDGRYTYVWNDEMMQVLYHVATAMPCQPHDPHCNEKRKYIGNDFASIVYNDSGEDFNIHTIKGHFNLCIVVVEPLQHGLCRVQLKTKDERVRTKFLAHLAAGGGGGGGGAVTVTPGAAALLARQLALHGALAAHISSSLRANAPPHASNSLARLRLIKLLRARLEQERLERVARAPKPYAPHPDLARRIAMDDFNDYS